MSLLHLNSSRPIFNMENGENGNTYTDVEFLLSATRIYTRYVRTDLSKNHAHPITRSISLGRWPSLLPSSLPSETPACMFDYTSPPVNELCGACKGLFSSATITADIATSWPLIQKNLCIPLLKQDLLQQKLNTSIRSERCTTHLWQLRTAL